MHNLESTNLNNEKQLLIEKSSVLDMYRELSFKQKQTRDSVTSLYFEVNKKEILLKDKTLEDSQRSMLKYDFTLTRRELEKTLHQKEVLNKDLTILQRRLKQIENELSKTKPWWHRYLNFIQ